MNKKRNHLIATVVMMAALLLTCSRPSAPELDNPFDKESDGFIPTADIRTKEVTNIRALQAESGGTFVTGYGKPVTAKGVCWSSEEEPTVADDCTNDGHGHDAFTSVMDGLEPDRIYYVRAYATNEAGTIYGEERAFTTRDGIAVLSTQPARNVSSYSAKAGGVILDDGGAALNDWGICYAKQPEPDENDFCLSANHEIEEQELYRRYEKKPGKEVLEPMMTGLKTSQIPRDFFSEKEKEFEIALIGLQPDQTYYYRAYAKTQFGKAWGENRELTTRDGLAVLNTTEPFDITALTAMTGGEVVDDGGAEVIDRGVCYIRGSGEPELSDTCAESGTGLGSFEVLIEDLEPEQLYTVKAYASTQRGTTWGQKEVFTTDGVPPSVTIIEISDITESSAQVSADVTNEGSSPVTDRGVCYATTQNPSSSDSCVSSGSGSGWFTSELTGLSPDTTYYVRAYATSSVGTAYGIQESFTTFHTIIVQVTNPVTGRIWMDRNLGADRVADSSKDTEAYGYLYQWGRPTDGHQLRTSATTYSLSSSDQPGHDNHILSNTAANWDWRAPQNDNLWMGVDGINNPCPYGYRLPTEAEWDDERQSWNTDNAAGAYASPLRLPVAGYRGSSHGWLNTVGSFGFYWSATVFGTNARGLSFSSTYYNINVSYRANGYSVRCIKD